MLDSSPDPQSSSRRTVGLCAVVFGHLLLALVVLTVLGLGTGRAGTALAVRHLLRSWMMFLPVAVGASLVLSMKGVDLSVGAVMALGGMIFAQIAEAGSSSGPSAALVAGILGAAVGALNGALAVGFRVPSYIATLGTGSLLCGAMLSLSGARMIQLDRPASPWVAGMLATLLTLCAMGLAAWLGWHWQGRLERVVCGEASVPGEAEWLRARSRWVQGAGFVVAGSLAGLAGAWQASQYRVATPVAGADVHLAVLAAALLGGAILFHGRGRVVLSMVGAVGGALAVTLAQNAAVLHGISALAHGTVVGALLLEGCVLFGVVRLIEQAVDRGALPQDEAGPEPGAPEQWPDAAPDEQDGV